jgi:RNA polymerase alpha subunit
MPVSECVELMQQPIFLLELGLRIDSGKSPFSVALLNEAITSSLTPGKAGPAGENRWEIAVETLAMGYPTVLVDIRENPVNPLLAGPTVFVNIPWGCLVDDVKYVAEFVHNMTERLDCNVFYKDREIAHPLLRVLPLYKKQGEIIARELKKMLDRACIVTSILKPLPMLGLSVRTSNCLWNKDFRILADVVTYTEEQMLKSQNFGRKSLNELKDLLVSEKLCYGMEIDLLGFRHAVSHVVPKQVSQDLDFRSGMCDSYLQNFIIVLADYLSAAFERKQQSDSKARLILGRVELPEMKQSFSEPVMSPDELLRKTRSDALKILDS